MDRLKGKVAIVTGSTKGIGEGIVRCFVQEGCKVMVTSRHEDEAKAMAEQLGMKDGMASYCRADVTKEEDIVASIEKTLGTFGKLDILVNNAGCNIAGDLDVVTLDDFNYTIATDLTSTFLYCKHCLPHLKKTKGNIINVSSMAAFSGFMQAAAYSPSKAGQIALTQSIALDHGKDGIRANALCPGHIKTPLADGWYEDVDKDGSLLKTVEARHPIGRRGTIEDCGWACVYLASDEASFVTGICLDVDGGVTLGY